MGVIAQDLCNEVERAALACRRLDDVGSTGPAEPPVKSANVTVFKCQRLVVGPALPFWNEEAYVGERSSMSDFEIYIRGNDFTTIETTLQRILGQVRQGIFDEDLKSVGRSGSDLTDSSLAVSTDQNMSPDEWLAITTVFGPVVAAAARDIWRIVFVPQLKRTFHHDNVAEKRPSRRKTK